MLATTSLQSIVMLRALRALAKDGTVPVCLMRGGTSKGLFAHASDLALPGPERDAQLLRLMGSPDASGMQLDGLGGGVSSTSKVAVMDVVEMEDAAGDRTPMASYLFGQVALREASVDWSGACGNLGAAAGLFALEQALLPRAALRESHVSPAHVVVPVWQANAGYRMDVHVPTSSLPPLPHGHDEPPPVPAPPLTSIPGVPGEAPSVLVEIVDPCAGQARSLLPTGRAVDELTLDGRPVRATLLWAANPTVFVFAADVGLGGTELPADVDYAGHVRPFVDSLLWQAAERMGTDVTAAMRVCWVAPPQAYVATDGAEARAADFDVCSRITTEGRVHHAHTVTGALNLAIASCIPGTVVADAAGAGAGGAEAGKTRPRGEGIRIGHPAGVMHVTAEVRRLDCGQWHAQRAGVLRTARTLIAGLA